MSGPEVKKKQKKNRSVRLLGGQLAQHCIPLGLIREDRQGGTYKNNSSRVYWSEQTSLHGTSLLTIRPRHLQSFLLHAVAKRRARLPNFCGDRRCSLRARRCFVACGSRTREAREHFTHTHTHTPPSTRSAHPDKAHTDRQQCHLPSTSVARLCLRSPLLVIAQLR